MEIPTVTQHDNDDEDRIIEIADNDGNINNNNNDNVEDMIPGILINVTMVTQQYMSDLEDEKEEDEDVKDMEEEKDDGVAEDENGEDDENGDDDDDDVIVGDDGDDDNNENGSVMVDGFENNTNENNLNEMIPIVTPKKTMKLKWNKDADKKSKNKSVEIKAHRRSTKNSSSETTTTKKKIQMKIPIVKSSDHSMAISIDFENKRDYIKNFYKWQVEIHNNKKMGKK